jgi:hypothetical protein
VIFEEHGEKQVYASARRVVAFAMATLLTGAESYTKYSLGVTEAYDPL